MESIGENNVRTSACSVKIMLQKKAFTVGETIPIYIVVDNTTGTCDIDYVEGRVVLKGQICSDSKTDTMINIQGKLERKDLHVTKGNEGQCYLSLLLDFSEEGLDNNLLPIAPGTWENNASVLQPPSYHISINVEGKSLIHDHYDLEIPIKVGTVNTMESAENMDDVD